jgi:hypothetical protein
MSQNTPLRRPATTQKPGGVLLTNEAVHFALIPKAVRQHTAEDAQGKELRCSAAGCTMTMQPDTTATDSVG